MRIVTLAVLGYDRILSGRFRRPSGFARSTIASRSLHAHRHDRHAAPSRLDDRPWTRSATADRPSTPRIAANAALTVLLPDQTSFGGDCFLQVWVDGDPAPAGFNGSAAPPPPPTPMRCAPPVSARCPAGGHGR